MMVRFLSLTAYNMIQFIDKLYFNLLIRCISFYCNVFLFIKIDGTTMKFKPSYEFGDRREYVTGARTYFYEDEEKCDENLEHFIRGIDAVSGDSLCFVVSKSLLKLKFKIFSSKFEDIFLKHVLMDLFIYICSGATNATGFAAVKLTALGRPQFLVLESFHLSACNI